MAGYIFRTPRLTVTADGPEALPREHRLARFYTRQLGVGVVVWPDGTVTERRVLRGDEHLAAAAVYLGGHDYPVTHAEKDVLESAGYTVLTV